MLPELLFEIMEMCEISALLIASSKNHWRASKRVIADRYQLDDTKWGWPYPTQWIIVSVFNKMPDVSTSYDGVNAALKYLQEHLAFAKYSCFCCARLSSKFINFMKLSFKMISIDPDTFHMRKFAKARNDILAQFIGIHKIHVYKTPKHDGTYGQNTRYYQFEFRPHSGLLYGNFEIRYHDSSRGIEVMFSDDVYFSALGYTDINM